MLVVGKKYIKHCLSYFWNLKYKIMVSILCISLSILFNLVMYKKSFMNKGLLLSSADCFVILDTILIKGIFLIPFALFFFCIIINYNENIQIIIRYKSKKKLWNCLVSRTLYVSMIFSAIETLLIHISSSFICEDLFNWDQKSSLFAYETDNILSENQTTYNDVVFRFLIITFLSTFIIGMFVLVTKYISNSFIVSWIIVFIIIIGERFSELNILLKRINIYYDTWLESNNKTYLYAAILLLSLYIIGIIFAERREYIETPKT